MALAHHPKTAAINGEFHLPEPIIERIQSFLPAKEAAQTTTLSKSWYQAWLTRPNLDFDETDFPRGGSVYGFEAVDFYDFAKNTIQRYEDLDLAIESFRLHVEGECYDRDVHLETELILKALELGASATRLVFELEDSYGCIVLPHEVFEAESLVRLSLDSCRIDRLSGRDQVRCSRLESLCLKEVEMESSDVIYHIISSCPLIKYLSLSNIGHTFDGRMNHHKFYKLRCLVLEYVNIDDALFSGDFSSRFPSLKDLTLKRCHLQEEIEISSRSLERLNLVARELRGKFDVPNIRKFTFEGWFITSVSFKTTAREWESHVSITDRHASTALFYELSKLLTELSHSKTYLSLRIISGANFDYMAGDIEGLPKPEVESLTMGVDHLSCLAYYALFDGLFRLCRPKLITQDLLPGNIKSEFLCKIIVQGMNEKCLNPTHFMYDLRDLKDLNIEIFEESVAEWRRVPLESWLDSSTESNDKQNVRFQLKWRLKPSAKPS